MTDQTRTSSETRRFDFDCPNCDDRGCDLCQPHVKPAASEQNPTNDELLAVLTRCARGAESLADTAAAVRKLFAAAAHAPAPVQAEAVAPVSKRYMLADQLEAQYLQLADKHGDVAELCRLCDYDPDKGRVPDHWKPLFMGFFTSAVNLGAAQSGNQVTMNGHQLKTALALAWPDGESDPDQGYTVVTIANMPGGPASDEDGHSVDMPAGLYLSYDDMPDEGMQELPEEPEPGSNGATS